MNAPEIKLERLKPMLAAYTHAQSSTPEEDAQKRIFKYAETNGLLQKGARLFGRNTYPTDKPEPHGYEYFLTLEKAIEGTDEVAIKEFPGGLYAVLRIKSLFNIAEGWKTLFERVQKSGYEPVGLLKDEHGWINAAFEEHLNWQDTKPPSEWVFDLLVQLKE